MYVQLNFAQSPILIALSQILIFSFSVGITEKFFHFCSWLDPQHWREKFWKISVFFYTRIWGKPLILPCSLLHQLWFQIVQTGKILTFSLLCMGPWILCSSPSLIWEWMKLSLSRSQAGAHNQLCECFASAELCLCSCIF